MKRVEVVAHRGFSSVAPENTMLSFVKAIQARVDMIELDVRMTADRDLVVIHDETVDRTTTGSGRVGELTVAQIKELTIRNPYDPLSEEKIPTFAEVLAYFQKAPHIQLNVELKIDQMGDRGMEALVVQQATRFGFNHRVIYSSFHHQTLKRIKQLNPKASIAVLYDEKGLPEKPWEDLLEMGADAIHPHYTTINHDWIEICHQHHIRVRPYTVNHIADMKQLLELGVHGIITDYPDRFHQILDK